MPISEHTLVPQGKLFIISGPSQVGKDSIVLALWQTKSLKLTHVLTNTTRAKRPGEQDGVDYNFLTEPEFQTLIDKDELLEWAIVRGCRFGTPKTHVLQALAQGKNVILNIDVQGAKQVLAKLPQATVLIFITAESPAEVKRRIFASTKMTLEQKEYRWREAQTELKAAPTYHHAVVNKLNKLQAAVAEVRDIILKYTA